MRTAAKDTREKMSEVARRNRYGGTLRRVPENQTSHENSAPQRRVSVYSHWSLYATRSTHFSLALSVRVCRFESTPSSRLRVFPTGFWHLTREITREIARELRYRKRLVGSKLESFNRETSQSRQREFKLANLLAWITPDRSRFQWVRFTESNWRAECFGVNPFKFFEDFFVLFRVWNPDGLEQIKAERFGQIQVHSMRPFRSICFYPDTGVRFRILVC